MKKAKPQISKITIGRVFNLGNYENVRYEITVDVTNSGLPASKVIVGMERLINAMNPNDLKRCESEVEISRLESRLVEAVKMDDETWMRNFGTYKGTRGEILERLRKQLNETREKRQKALARAEKVRELFDDLGGLAEWKDAKMEWETDKDYEEEVPF